MTGWSLEKSRRAMAEAREVIPGGVNSPVRAFGGVGGIPLHRRRRGMPGLRRGRKRVRGLRGFMGSHDPGACPPRGGGRGARRGRSGDELRSPHRRGDGARPARGLPHAGDGDGASGEQRHRGHHVGAPAGPRPHRPAEVREVRGVLSRPRRRVSHPGRVRSHHPRGSQQPRGAGGGGGRHPPGAVQRPGPGGRALPRPSRRDRRGDRRAGGGEHGVDPARGRGSWRAFAISPGSTARSSCWTRS